VHLFHCYPNFDKLVSVCDATSNANKKELAKLYCIEPNKFISCQNCINAKQIIEHSQMPLDQDLKQWIRNRICFITIGRLSPEKAHVKLIQAFAHIHQHYPNICLLILGIGPLMSTLQQVSKQLKLEAHILLGGYRSNPYPSLRRASCFVLSSDHEGQAVTLTEAMVLNKPIIATNIPGNNAAIKQGYGLIVKNSVQGLAEGMQSFLNDNMESAFFDADKYNVNCLNKFKQLVEQ
jgi:CDP-glycerol glycerophosphotransferase